MRRARYIFAIASLIAVAAGCVAVASSGARSGIWGRNAAAWVIGAGLTWLCTYIPPARLLRWVLVLAPLALVVSLGSAGQSGVHRWISLGPLNWNAAFLCLPAATVALASTGRIGSWWTWGPALVIGCALVLQPDASQATAFAAAMLVTLPATPFPRRMRVVVSLLIVIAVGIAWIRPDPLQPVPEVEGIIQTAGTVSAGLAILAVTALAAASASPLAARTEVRDPARALFAYFLCCAVMPLFGAFPVPLAGMGMSPIIGYWLGIGTLRRTTYVVSAEPTGVLSLKHGML